ncbi:hypothetical protein YC2023_104500 [Brassica napus]
MEDILAYGKDFTLFPGWSVRSNVAEYEHNYVVAVELRTRDSIKDTRVEVDNKHKAPKIQFKISWPLPRNVNKDNVSAELSRNYISPQSNIMILD